MAEKKGMQLNSNQEEEQIRSRVQSSMGYKEYVHTFDRVPKCPLIKPSKYNKVEFDQLENFELEPITEKKQAQSQPGNFAKVTKQNLLYEDDQEISEENNSVKLPTQNNYFGKKKMPDTVDENPEGEDEQKEEEKEETGEIGHIFSQLDIREKSQTLQYRPNKDRF